VAALNLLDSLFLMRALLSFDRDQRGRLPARTARQKMVLHCSPRISLPCAMKKNDPLPFPVAKPSPPPEIKAAQTILWRVANQRFAFHIHVEVQTLPPDPGTLIPFPLPKDSAS